MGTYQSSCFSYPACNSHTFYAVFYCCLWPFWPYRIFPHYLITGTIFETNIKHKMRVLIFFTTYAWNISYSKKTSVRYYRCTRLRVKYPLFVSDFNDTWIFLDRFSKKYSNIIFYENPFSGSRVVPCGQTDMTKLMVAVCNFANEPTYFMLYPQREFVFCRYLGAESQFSL